jgi:hypothetical protein
VTDTPDLSIIPLDRLDMRIARMPWPFACERRAEIDAYFAALQRNKPQLWNGRVLVLHRGEFAGGTLRGAYIETDFASFLAWRDWGVPDRSVRNCFPMAALRSADGAFLLGVMGPHTANAGHVYFAAGMPDPDDIVGETVDLESGVMRELVEETGLGPADVEIAPGWFAVPYNQRLALMKVMQSPEEAQALRARILSFLAGQDEPELSDIRIVRTVADLDPMMPPYVAAFLRSRLG